MTKATALIRFARRFAGSDAGNFAMISALIAIPLVGMLGMGIDMTRAYISEVRLQGAVDNAALAAATLKGESDAKIKEIARNYFYANYKADFWAPPTEPEITLDEDKNVTITAHATSRNYFLNLFGYEEFPVLAIAAAVAQSRGLEVVMVLDVTGSMSGNKLKQMKSAATDLVDILFGDIEEHEKLRIGLVPFSGSVKLDPDDAVAGGWIDTTGQSKYARINFDTSLANNYAYAMYTQYIKDPDWSGCVEARPNRLDETDTPPSAADPDTKWVPFFYPDGPDGGNWQNWVPKDGDNQTTDDYYVNSYVDDKIKTNPKNKTNADKQQTYSKKYQNKNLPNDPGQNGSGPFRMCVASSILPLNNKKTTVKNAISGLDADGYTHVALGASWGWRVISPTEPYTEGLPYGEKDWDKAIIVLTDGDNTMPTDAVNSAVSNNGGSEYTAYGFASDERMGSNINTASKMEAEQDKSLERTCANIKAVKKPDGKPAIIVYTITFGNEVDTGTIKSVMQGCASSQDNFFDARSGLDLEVAFKAIAAELSRIRLTK